MDGRDISTGSVGTAKAIENAVKIARQIMERTDHVMIVSDRITNAGRTGSNSEAFELY
jgi:isoaspartyl peptidase/L-asparaginase-like protein (Ntn-hydrolase superfamily)